MNICNYLSNVSLLGGLRIKDFEISIEKTYPYNIWIRSVKEIKDGGRELRATTIELEKYYYFTISAIVFGSLSDVNVDHLRFRYDYYNLPRYMKMSFLGSKYI